MLSTCDQLSVLCAASFQHILRSICDVISGGAKTQTMSVLENNVNKSKKNKKQQKSKKQKAEKPTESNKIEESNENSSVVAVTETLVKKKNKIKKENTGNSEVAAIENSSKKKKKIDDNKESNEDNSVFAVTEKLLQKKKEKKEKKLEEGLKKTKAEMKQKVDDRLVKIKEFFQENIDSKGVKGKAKPKWFDVKLKKTVATYLKMVENFKEDPIPENKLIINEKILYNFFLRLSKHLGEEISVIRHWFHTTKKGILKSGLNMKDDNTLKFSHLNKKFNAIVKEIAEAPVPKSDKAPVWFDEKFAKLIQIRNKARREHRLSPTDDNKKAYILALKKVKTEQKARKKSGFVSTEPYSKDNEKTKSTQKSFKPTKRYGPSNVKSGEKFGSSKPTEKSSSFTPSNVKSPRSFTPSSAKPPQAFGSFTPNVPNKHIAFGSFTPNVSNKHIKFDD